MLPLTFRDRSLIMSDTPSSAKTTDAEKMRVTDASFLCTVAVAILALTAFRIALFWIKPFWLDETFTAASLYNETLRSLFENWIKPDVHPPLYPILMFFWAKLFGISDIALRVPSFLCGVAAIATLFFGLRGALGTATAAIGALTLAAAPNAITYSVEARPYGLVLLLASLSSVYAVRFALSARRADLIGFSIASILLAFTHYFGLLLSAGLYLWLILRDLRNSPRLLLPCLVFGAVLTPWLAYHLPSLLNKTNGHFWIPQSGLLYDVVTSLGGAWGETGFHNAVWLEAILPFGFAILTRRRDTRLYPIAAALTLLTFVELALIVAISRSTPLLVPRYFLVFTPIAAIVAGILVAPLGGLARLAYALCLPLAVALPWAIDFVHNNRAQTITWEAQARVILDSHPASVVFLLDDPLNTQCSDHQLQRIGEFFFRRAGSTIPVIVVSLKSRSLGTDLARDISAGPKPVVLLAATSRLWSYANHKPVVAHVARGGLCKLQDNIRVCLFR